MSFQLHCLNDSGRPLSDEDCSDEKIGATGRLLEMETAAWKDDRRFRLLTVDNGTFSFTDLMFNTPGKPASKGVASPPPPLALDSITITGTLTVVSRYVELTSVVDLSACLEWLQRHPHVALKLSPSLARHLICQHVSSCVSR